MRKAMRSKNILLTLEKSELTLKRYVENLE